jgi:hypothetical protein
MTTPSADDFAIWRDNPVTAWVLAGVQRFADLQKVAWADGSWADGKADQQTLDRLRTRADAYEGLATLTYEQAVGLHPSDGAEDA